MALPLGSLLRPHPFVAEFNLGFRVSVVVWRPAEDAFAVVLLCDPILTVLAFKKVRVTWLWQLGRLSGQGRASIARNGLTRHFPESGLRSLELLACCLPFGLDLGQLAQVLSSSKQGLLLLELLGDLFIGEVDFRLSAVLVGW